MKAVFISDAHLRQSADERYRQFIRFLADLTEGRIRTLVDVPDLGCENTPIDDIYILGDLFDFWFCGPDCIHPEFQEVIGKLAELKKSGVRIHLFEGNHDFYMKEYFQDVLGMEVFEEWATIELDGWRVMVSHGDTVDSSNWRYLLLRKILRSRPFYHVQRYIPAPIRWALAGLTSDASKQINDERGDILVEKMFSFASEKLHKDYDAVIMGHCHKPVIRYLEAAGRNKTFVTLGDWVNHYSFLYYEDGKFFMSHYRPE